MEVSERSKGVFPAKFINDYLWLIQYSAVGFYFLLTFGVLYSCIFVAYPQVFDTLEQKYANIIYLMYVLCNMMGNFFLGSITDSSFKTGYVLSDPPKTWMFCTKCNQHTPPRSHHCFICRACVLKQDHHCFFFTRCVGLRNQKYFIPYVLYVFLGSFHALRTILVYLNTTYVPLEWSFYCIFSYLFPGPIYNWYWDYGDVTFGKFVSISVLYGCFSTTSGCLFLFVGEMFLVARGQTPYEFGKGIRKYSQGVYNNYKQVFGKLFPLNFLFPLPNKTKEEKSPWGEPTFYRSI
uniref:Palmitoyltransferase n=1 Tax=Phallusia mammillata TaxID=59560 RepID=A0A6F9DXK7_9ASCI|nr:palmitoyltransferase ZDHHC22-like [Phallusia mammillata]